MNKNNIENIKYANRAKRAFKTKSDMDKLYNTLSDKDKKLLGDDKASKEWLTKEEGEFVVKRFLMKHGNVPIAALDIMTTTKKGHLTLAVMTNPDYRGYGFASELVNKAYDWFIKNAKKYDAHVLEWGVYTDNEESVRLAEKSGFVYDKKASDDKWSVYVLKRK